MLNLCNFHCLTTSFDIKKAQCMLFMNKMKNWLLLLFLFLLMFFVMLPNQVNCLEFGERKVLLLNQVFMSINQVNWLEFLIWKKDKHYETKQTV